MKVSGIWIDRKGAQIFRLEEEDAHVLKIISGIEDFNPRGGARSRQKWGPMDKMDERKLNKRKHHQEQTYCKKVYNAVRDESYVYLFGPAQMKDILAKYIHEQPSPKPQIIGIDTAGYLTDNQKMAHVRTVFAEIISG